MKVRYRALALANLESIFQYLNERSPTGAQHVLHALHDAIDDHFRASIFRATNIRSEFAGENTWAISLQDFLQRCGSYD